MRYCKRGHDIELVGRTKSRNCRECLRAWERVRNRKRRTNPEYRERERERMRERYATDPVFRQKSLIRTGIYYLREAIERDVALARQLIADGAADAS